MGGAGPLQHPLSLPLATKVTFCKYKGPIWDLIFLFCGWQLLRIEEELGEAAVYAGAKFRAPVEPY
jgi:hypothetical protein